MKVHKKKRHIWVYNSIHWSIKQDNTLHKVVLVMLCSIVDRYDIVIAHEAQRKDGWWWYQHVPWTFLFGYYSQTRTKRILTGITTRHAYTLKYT